jgi:NAD+ synthase
VVFGGKILELDVERETERICEFIRSELFSHYKRKGVVIGLSGGIDSALLASVCVRALGPDRVVGVVLPERDSSPDSAAFAAEQADSLGIRYEQVDITPILETLGAYERRNAVIRNLCPGFDAENDHMKIALPHDLLHHDGLNVFSLIVEKPNGEQFSCRLKPEQLHEIAAAQNMKQRTRMIQLYSFAERLHYIVGGTTNRTEMEQGFFVKFGDGGVDIEPLAHLFKTQVFQISRYVGVVNNILERLPTPDTWPGGVTDEEFYFRIPFDKLDLLLYAWLEGLKAADVCAALDLEEAQVERAFRDFQYKNNTTWHLRALPPSLVGGSLIESGPANRIAAE